MSYPPGSIAEKFRDVLGAQALFSADNTQEMKQRGLDLKDACDRISRSIRPLSWATGLQTDWSGGTGSKSRVPWIRIFEASQSPKPTAGFYVVFLFCADGSGVFLSVNQGTQLWENGRLADQPPDQIMERARVARLRWNRSTTPWPEAVSVMDLQGPGQRLAENYQAGNVAARLYRTDLLPDDRELVLEIERAFHVYREVLTDGIPSKLSANVGTELTAAPPPDLSAIVDDVATSLANAGLSFGAQHLDRVRTFIVSLAAKRFVILTGLSGSGKTQLALRVGQWLDRWDVIPVRPDWTGPEALLGYEDALQQKHDGRSAWHVPRVLKFLLRARDNADRPHLLVLDEMNLAHVERYFADILSGMESGEPCIPDLVRDTDGSGCWRKRTSAAPDIPFPRNVFVVGTVNVDETTYQFSPKVLDRANTIEFRVTAEDLAVTAKPSNVAASTDAMTSSFLSFATDDRWHLVHPAAQQDALANHLRSLHRLLARDGFEFGHRVYYEAMRFAALLQAAGQPALDEALDLLVMQKILPRLHGGRRRLEPALRALAYHCVDADKFDEKSAASFDVLAHGDKPARQRQSLTKLQRMMRLVQENQFASFAE